MSKWGKEFWVLLNHQYFGTVKNILADWCFAYDMSAVPLLHWITKCSDPADL